MAGDYFNKMRLLMWKHYLQRKRRYIATSLEIILPIIIVYFLCKESAPLLTTKSEHKKASIPSAFDLSTSSGTWYRLACSPSTDFAKKIINNVQTVLNVIEVKYFPDETQLELFLSADESYNSWFGVVLVSNSTADEKFEYKIRTEDHLLTDSKFLEQPGAATEFADPYRHGGFASLQYALDASYIQSVKPEFTTKTYKNYAAFQPFPYPEYNEEQNKLRHIITTVVYGVIILTSVIMASPLVNSIIEEKDAGLKELMKLVGLNECSTWLSWFLNAMVVNVVVYTIVTIILYHQFGEAASASLNKTSATVFWSFLVLFSAANITFCFIFCAIFHSTAVASTLISLLYFTLACANYFVSSKRSLFLNRITCLTPVGALYQGFERITYAENHDEPLNWLSLNTVERNEDLSFEFVLMMLSFDICLYLALTYYITMINPGKFGSPKSPFFIFEKLTSIFRKDKSTYELVNLDDSIESKYFERPTSDLVVSLQIKDLHKYFASLYAVRNVNLNIYKGEITALLGHNGAGKTTTMGILTGECQFAKYSEGCAAVGRFRKLGEKMIMEKSPETCYSVATGLLGTVYFVSFAFFSVELLNYFSTYLCVERVDGFKHIQFMSNLSPFVYWLGTWAFDVVFFAAIFTLRVFILKIFDYHNFLAVDGHFAVLMLVPLLFALSGTIFLYVTNYLASNKSRATMFMSILNIVGLVVVGVYFSLLCIAINWGTPDSFYFYLLKYVVLLTPTFNYSLIMIKLIRLWLENTLCSRCPSSYSCRSGFTEHDYMASATEDNPFEVFEETIFLAGSFFLYAVFLALIQMGYVARFWNAVIGRKWNTHGDVYAADEEDDDVKNERNNVPSDAILLVNGLKKIYTAGFKPMTAVADVTFAVKPGQCFGLLGVNGAGKSTTFKMLTSHTVPTAGDASIMGATLSRNETTYLRKVGYCAQTNCFIEELTGREMLTLTASLRGVRANRLQTLVNKWIDIVGLGSYQNRRCGSYSGGNKRKLCAAMSLIGDPHVVFLVEPTTGVDPVSRRKLYDVMEQSKRSGQAVVLSSHSMDECEKLCDRLTIMSNGRLKCIGTVQHLKQRYAQGFSILIKTRDLPDSNSLIDNVKRKLTSTFGPQFCVLKDEHKGLLYYQIQNTSLLWSQLFENMERIRAEHEVIEDYTISDTSLEEVFLSFAKQASKK